MALESKNFFVIRKDFVVLVPGASLVITFSPRNGAMLAAGNSKIVTSAAILGADVQDSGPPVGPVGPAGLQPVAVVGVVAAADGTAAPTAAGAAPSAGAIRRGVVVTARANEATVAGALTRRLPGGDVAAPVRTPAVSADRAIEFLAKQAPALRPGLNMDLDLIGGGLVVLPDPGGQPEAPKKVRIEVFRPGQNQPIGSRDVSAGGLPLQVTGISTQGLGLAPETWTAKFTNISNTAIECFGEVRFRERRELKVTTINKGLLGRLLRQAVEGLGLTINAENNDLSIDFDPLVKKYSKHALKRIEIGLPGNVSEPVTSNRPDVSLEEVEIDGEIWPALKIKLQLVPNSFELELDSLPHIELADFDFELTISMTQRLRNWAALQDNSNPHRGDFPLVPFIFADINLDTRAHVANPVLGPVIRAFLGDIRDILQVEINKQALALSRYFQGAIHRLADQTRAFHGLRLNGNGDWEVLTGPVFQVTQPLIPLPMGPVLSTEPLGGPQPPEELAQLNAIDHIVVLMMENRSYDHVLGHLSHPDHGNDPRYNGLRGHERNRIAGIRPDAAPGVMQTTQFYPSPPHGFGSVARQVAQGVMDGFGEEFRRALLGKRVVSDPRSIMNFHTLGQLPVYDRLVRDFTVATNWYSALPGPTFPNRFCAIAGQTPILENDDLSQDDAGYLRFPTVFDLLSDAGANGAIDWKFYEHDLTMLRMMDRYRLDSEHIRPFSEFATDAQAGLPRVTFIDPNFVDVPGGGVANDDHPGGADMADGQNLIAGIVNTLAATQGWPNTMLIITYDEHGGFFDHVAPPGSAANPHPGVTRVHPNGPAMLGVRVPAFIVSPRATPGATIDRIFDHTSIIKTIISRFLPGQERSLGPRVAQAAHLGGALSAPPQVFQQTSFNMIASSPLSVAEEIDAGSFHDFMRSLGSPVHRSSALTGRLLSDLD
jgi:phospholipase C